jgi:hypothetical protein
MPSDINAEGTTSGVESTDWIGSEFEHTSSDAGNDNNNNHTVVTDCTPEELDFGRVMVKEVAKEDNVFAPEDKGNETYKELLEDEDGLPSPDEEEDLADIEDSDLDPDHIAERENHSEIDSPNESDFSSSPDYEPKRLSRPPQLTLEERMDKEQEDLKIKTMDQWVPRPRRRGGYNKRRPLQRQTQDLDLVPIQTRKEDPEFDDHPYPGLGFRPEERESIDPVPVPYFGTMGIRDEQFITLPTTKLYDPPLQLVPDDLILTDDPQEYKAHHGWLDRNPVLEECRKISREKQPTAESIDEYSRQVGPPDPRMREYFVPTFHPKKVSMADLDLIRKTKAAAKEVQRESFFDSPEATIVGDPSSPSSFKSILKRTVSLSPLPQSPRKSTSWEPSIEEPLRKLQNRKKIAYELPEKRRPGKKSRPKSLQDNQK